jgi:hypothetical protein
MSKNNSEWLELLCSHLSCSPRFLEALDRQLSEQMTALTRIDVHAGFVIFPEATPAHYDEIGVGYAAGDLTGPDAFGYPVRVAWTCGSHRAERITPDDSLPSTRGCAVRAWWAELPADELREKYAGPGQPPIPIGHFSFEVEWWPLAWPDVWMEVWTQQDASVQQIEAINAKLEQKREKWNSRSEERGFIHNWSGLQCVGACRFEMNIDFGSAGPGGLSYWLQAIESACSALLPRRVIARGYSIAQ